MPLSSLPMVALRAEHRQQQTLSPRLQHAVRLLQLSSLEFSQEVRAALGRNPFLEADEPEADAAPAAPGDAPAAPAAEAAPAAASEGLGDPPDDAWGSDRDLWQGDRGPGPRNAERGELSAIDLTPVTASLAAHLHGQLGLMRLPQRDAMLAGIIIESLDEDGYLRTPLEELAELVDEAELSPLPDAEEMQVALRRVQALEPAGVGARDVRECLLLQLPAITCPEQRALAHCIVAEHLPALAAKDIPQLARRLGRGVDEIEAVCARIRHLDPRPGWRHGGGQPQYIVPDVIVRKRKGNWVATLNPAVVPRVRLNRVYAELFERHRQAGSSELAANLQEARWTVRNVAQRFSTILDVAQAIVDRQRHFLDYGTMAMKPLGLHEIAVAVGVHESTVSRVTHNKYMATPAGVFELKYFFSRAMSTASGQACSATAVRSLIKEMIEAESPAAPLSDAEIARQLDRQGLHFARRTVTKYRQLLRIQPVEQRRRYGDAAAH